jgi:hypothetical protein
LNLATIVSETVLDEGEDSEHLASAGFLFHPNYSFCCNNFFMKHLLSILVVPVAVFFCAGGVKMLCFVM